MRSAATGTSAVTESRRSARSCVAVPVFERRLAAVVLLQSHLAVLDNSDLTRIEGFLRGARLRELADPLAVDVVLERWLQDPDPWLRRAALLAPTGELRSGAGRRRKLP